MLVYSQNRMIFLGPKTTNVTNRNVSRIRLSRRLPVEKRIPGRDSGTY